MSTSFLGTITLCISDNAVCLMLMFCISLSNNILWCCQNSSAQLRQLVDKLILSTNWKLTMWTLWPLVAQCFYKLVAVWFVSCTQNWVLVLILKSQILEPSTGHMCTIWVYTCITNNLFFDLFLTKYIQFSYIKVYDILTWKKTIMNIFKSDLKAVFYILEIRGKTQRSCTLYPKKSVPLLHLFPSLNVQYVLPNCFQNCLQLLRCIRPSFAATISLV